MSKESKEPIEFVPRRVKHKKKKKKQRTTYIILAIVLLLSAGGISAAVFSSGLFPQQLLTSGIDLEQQKAENPPAETKPIDDPNQRKTPAEEVIGDDLNEDPPELEHEKQPEVAKETNISEKNQTKSTPPTQNTSNSNENGTPSISKPTESKPELIIIHKVRPNETLFSITKKYYLNVDKQNKIAQFNGITNPANDMKAGLELQLPDPDIIAVHEVIKDETLFSITKKYYGGQDQLITFANYNSIVDPLSDIKVGMKLYIPHPTLLKNFTSEGHSIKVNKTTNTLTVYRNLEVVKSFSIATGKDSSLTPEGVFQIVNKVEKPWYNPKNIPGGDPTNPLGSHWLGLNVPGTNNYIYGIHGTNDPSSIGKHVSLGCIRMQNADVLWMYNNIPLHTTVYIFSE